MQEMASEGQSDRMSSDMEVCMKIRYGIEFLHIGKKKWHPLIFVDTCEDQLVDVSIVRW